MLRPDDAPPLTRGVVLRGAGLVVAVALGALAAWLIVTSTSQKHLQLGVLAGLWAALIGAFALFGARRRMHEEEPSTEVALRPHAEERAALERAEDLAERRAHEARLEQLLRREVQGAVAREVATLRAEIAGLRSELLEKVGGQLRLERIETTRLIGSDLEALQHELRELKAATSQEAEFAPRRPRAGDTGPLRQIVEPARVRPVSRQTAEVEADVLPARSLPESPPVAESPSSEAPAPAPQPAPVPSAPEAAPAELPPVRRPAPTLPGDDFAALPRIRPFTDFELDPIEPARAEPPAYSGRRRRPDDPQPGNGRHALPEPVGRRHRRDDADDETPDELLARLLSRDGS